MDSEIKLGLVQTALRKMYRSGGYFDVCAVREACRLCGIEIPAQTENAMQLLHCVHFRDMEPKVKAWLAKEIDSLFSNPDNIISNQGPRLLGSRIALSDNTLALGFGED